MLFKKLFKSKGTIKDTKDYTDCEIELINCTHYLKTLYMIKNNNFSNDIEITDVESLKDYLKFTQFYFYINIEVNLYDKLLDFLSRTNFISSVVNDKIHILVRLNGEEIINVYNSNDIRNIIYKNFRKSLLLINRIYFEPLINSGILSERDFSNNDEMDKEKNDQIYQSIISRLFGYTPLSDNSSIIIENNPIFYNKKLLEIFDHYKLYSFISPPVLLLKNNEIYQFNSISELLNEESNDKEKIKATLQNIYPYNIEKLLVKRYEIDSIISEEDYTEIIEND